MNLKKYAALTRAGVLEALQFRVSIIVAFVGNMFYLMVIYFLWKAIYASSGTDVVNGMTFSDTMIYLVLATALFNFMEMFTVWQIGIDIQSGKIVLDLLKPMKYQSYLFWSMSGNISLHFFTSFLPTFLVVYFLTNGYIHLGVNLLYFVISVILSVVINYCIDFFVGTICLYTESIWGINIMKQVIVLLLSGATIPVAFFPEPLKTIIFYLPFQSVYNSPLTLLINSSMSAAEAFKTLAMQLVWCFIMIIVSRLFWKVSLRKITVNGG